MNNLMIVTLVILCIVGIIAVAYNLVRYNYASDVDERAKQSARVVTLATGAFFVATLVIIIVILSKNCVYASSMVKPEVGSAQDLADIFKS